jgi:hypothetical protein
VLNHVRFRGQTGHRLETRGNVDGGGLGRLKVAGKSRKFGLDEAERTATPDKAPA